MPRRPKYNPRADANHSIVPEFIKGLGGEFGGLTLDCMDISKRGGRRVDWIMWLGPLAIAVEVKTAEEFRKRDSGMTKGEMKFFNTNPGPKALAVTMQDLAEIVSNHLGAAYALQAALEAE